MAKTEAKWQFPALPDFAYGLTLVRAKLTFSCSLWMMMELNRADEMIRKGQVKMKYLVGKVRIENRILILNSRILFQSVLIFEVAVIAKAQLFCLSKTQQSFEKQNQYLLFSLFFFLMFITEPDTTTSDYPAEKVLLET